MNRDRIYNSAYTPRPTEHLLLPQSSSGTEAPVPVTESAAMKTLRVVTYLTVIVTCLAVLLTLLQVYLIVADIMQAMESWSNQVSGDLLPK